MSRSSCSIAQQAKGADEFDVSVLQQVLASYSIIGPAVLCQDVHIWQIYFTEAAASGPLIYT